MMRLRFTGRCTLGSPVLITLRISSRSAHTCSHSASSNARFSTELARSNACDSDMYPAPNPGSSGSKWNASRNFSRLCRSVSIFWLSTYVASMPSSPYRNWITSPALLRTVPSYLTMMSSIAFTRRRWMYPVSDVFTAVSMSPSRPPIAWKKNSCGVSPRRYEFSTNPRDSGPKSSLVKCGNDRPLNPNGMRLPSTFCWPTHAIICEMFRNEPFDPACTVIFTLLVSSRLACAEFPALSRALFKIWFTFCSKDCCMVMPGCISSSPFCARLITSLTSAFALVMVSLMERIVPSSAMVSEMPMVNPWCRSQ